MADEPQKPAALFIPAGARHGTSDELARLPLPQLFPPPVETTPDGLLCVGGELTSDWLLDAYRHGIFPWPVWDEDPMAWWSPDPRAILEAHDFHIPRRLRRTLRSDKFQTTCDRDFAGVIHGCATAAGRRGGTWLTPAMINAYTEMHCLKYAHSVEVWHGDQLVGGIYGVALGGMFAAESMFYRVRDASKVALACLVAHLCSRGYRLLDVQQWTSHTSRFGVTEISRAEYLRRVAEVVDAPTTFGAFLEGDPLAS